MDICEKCGNPFPMGGWFQCPDHGRPHGGFALAAHPQERAVVYRSPEGKIVYPPRNDQPMPAIYANAGYERHEIPNLRAMEKFEKEQGVRNDAAWFDKGTGNADKLPESKPIDMTGLEFKPLG
jgi:hypothetical protein